MPDPTASGPAADEVSETPAPRSGWAATTGAALVAVVAGALLTTSAQVSSLTDEVRLGRGVELVELIRDEQARTSDLAGRVAELAAELEEVERTAGADREVAELRRRVDELAAPAGMVPLVGPGVVVTLADAATIPSGADANDHIIHEADLQAVINALWAGGAEAITVNGQRILATTAIRCVGNTLLLHGQTFPPPYEIAAIGDEPELRAELERDVAMGRFTRAVSTFGLGFDVHADEAIQLAAYDGTIGMSSARPVSPVDER